MFPTFLHPAGFSNFSIFRHACDNVYFNINFKFYNNLKIYHPKCYAEFKSFSLFFKPILLFVLFQLNLNHDQAVIFIKNFLSFNVCTKLV